MEKIEFNLKINLIKNRKNNLYQNLNLEITTPELRETLESEFLDEYINETEKELAILKKCRDEKVN